MGPATRTSCERAEEWVADLPEQFTDERIEESARSLLSGVVSIAIVAVVAVAVLVDGENLAERFRRLLSPQRRAQADEVGRVVYDTLGRYVGGSLTVAVMMGLFVLAVGLVLGVPLAPLAAVWAMLTDLIPQVGGALGGVVFVALALTESVPTAIIAGGLFVAYMTIENHVIQPAVVGRSVDLTPPTTMVAALIGGAVGRHPRRARRHAARRRRQAPLPRGPRPAPADHRSGVIDSAAVIGTSTAVRLAVLAVAVVVAVGGRRCDGVDAASVDDGATRARGRSPLPDGALRGAVHGGAGRRHRSGGHVDELPRRRRGGHRDGERRCRRRRSVRRPGRPPPSGCCCSSTPPATTSRCSPTRRRASGRMPAAYFISRITLADGKRAVLYGAAVVRPGDVSYVFYTDVGGDDADRARAFVESYTA